MKALFIGGTGTISTDVVALAQQRGGEITLLNRGSKKLPEGMRSIVADIHDEQAVAKAIAHESYDVVAQFIGYTAKDVERDIRFSIRQNNIFSSVVLLPIKNRRQITALRKVLH